MLSLDDFLKLANTRLFPRFGRQAQRWAIIVGRQDMEEAWSKWLKDPLAAWHTRCAQRAERPTMVALVEGDNLVLEGRAGLAVVLPRHLDRPLGCLRTTAKELDGVVLLWHEIRHQFG